MIPEELEQELREALSHLYDPLYRPPELLRAVTGCSTQPGAECVRTAIVRATEALKPGPNVPPSARAWRIYELLSYRYVQNLTQKNTAERLGITSRHLRREQGEAVLVLARWLWEQRHVDGSAADKLARGMIEQPVEAEAPNAKSPEWRFQVRQELASLQRSAPGSVADVGQTVKGVVKLGSALVVKDGISIQLKEVQPGLIAAIHPSALRQVLVRAIGQLAQHMSAGVIAIEATSKGKRVNITLSGRPAAANGPLGSPLIQEILTAQNGTLEVRTTSESISFEMALPAVAPITVLVVDDNLDLVHFYRRYTAGSRYQIVHVAQGREVFAVVESAVPDIIVLDVMLPDIDGWELLTHLHEHPATRSVPIIICSVIREKELALALGATLYLPKPVHRGQFIEALDQVLDTQRGLAAR